MSKYKGILGKLAKICTRSSYENALCLNLNIVIIIYSPELSLAA